MQENINNTNLSDSEEFIDLKQIFRFLYNHKKFILIITSLFTLLAIIYFFLVVTDSYKAKISFLSPDINSSTLVEHITERTFLEEERHYDLYKIFINKINSPEFRGQVFFEKGYDKILTTDNATEENRIIFYNQFINAIEFDQDEKAIKIDSYENPISISMEWKNKESMESFLKDLIDGADEKTIEEFKKIIYSSLQRQLNTINSRKEQLLQTEKLKRLDLITQIKEKNQVQAKEIQDEIDRLIIQEKTLRLNRIKELKEEIPIASKLGIIKNNFDLAHKDQASSLTVIASNNPAIIDDKKVPDWYLYGEKSLVEELQRLRQRKEDKSFIPEIAILENKLKNIELDRNLISLENRTDDSAFIKEIPDLLGKEKLLNLIYADFKNTFLNNRIYSMQVNQFSIEKELNMKNKFLMITIIAFFSFILSILIVYIRDFSKQP